ncbi:hypothetical protein A5680_06125 [Mycobacterium sp. E2989]|nr:hypothetical protein A5680_06125 [Mycobacterium sp. E2989]
MCVRETEAQLIWWDSEAAAVEAMRGLVCDESCVGVHSVVVQVGSRFRITQGPAPTVLRAVVVPGSSRPDPLRRLVACPYCGGEHQHRQRHIGSVRASGCLRGFYQVQREDDDR